MIVGICMLWLRLDGTDAGLSRLLLLLKGCCCGDVRVWFEKGLGARIEQGLEPGLKKGLGAWFESGFTKGLGVRF